MIEPMRVGVVLSLLACSFACGSENHSSYNPDAATLADGGLDAFPSQATYPNIVFVDGLVAGHTVDTKGAPLDLTDVRVCIYDAANNAITPYAIPDDAPLPLTNYPGVHRGGGIDLGAMRATGLVLHVFNATDLSEDAAWVSNRQDFACGLIACEQQPTCKPHVTLQATLPKDINVIALVDQAGDGGGSVGLKVSGYEDTGYAGVPGSLYGGVVNFTTVSASTASYSAGGATQSIIASNLLPDTATSPVLVTMQLGSYDTYGVGFQGTTTFWQSLDSIAFVTNQTIDPPTFYGVRKNFVFALIGDPTDMSVFSNGGRNPSFDGTGLHIVAVPYAEPPPAAGDF